MSSSYRRLRDIVERFQRELAVWRRVLADSRTPRAAKWLLGLAAVYAVTPVDIISDFISILGHLDDVVILALLVWLAIRLTPRGIVADARTAAAPGVPA